ncbi:hypothetical protein D3C85_1889850 [compost metagenome]
MPRIITSPVTSLPAPLLTNTPETSCTASATSRLFCFSKVFLSMTEILAGAYFLFCLNPEAVTTT